MDVNKIKLIAFDLDGTLTQHRSPLSIETRNTLLKLQQKYKLLMVGAGAARRIFNQMEKFPIDIIGNYGLQRAKYNSEKQDIDIVEDIVLPCDKVACTERVESLRQKYGFTEYKGDSVEFHASGCITFPILGTKADIEDKLKFDPDRSKRRKIYEDVKAVFTDYIVFVGGSSSFDFAPMPYNKYYALDKYCKELNLSHDEVVFVGDDYGPGGNDESVYKSDFNFIKIDNYLEFYEKIKILL